VARGYKSEGRGGGIRGRATNARNTHGEPSGRHHGVVAAAVVVLVAATTVAKAVYSSFLVETVIVRATVKARIPIARGASRQWQVLLEWVGNGR
jgi:hypothetical protein